MTPKPTHTPEEIEEAIKVIRAPMDIDLEELLDASRIMDTAYREAAAERGRWIEISRDSAQSTSEEHKEWRAEIEGLRSRLAEVEAERDSHVCSDHWNESRCRELLKIRDRASEIIKKKDEASDYARIILEEVKAWRDSPKNDGFPFDTRLSLEDALKKTVAALSLRLEDKP